MDIKPPISQGPIVQPDQTQIDAPHDKKSEQQAGHSTAENVQTSANTAQAMKQAGIEMKGSMRTSELFLRQALADQLETKVGQNEGRSTQLLGWPESQGKNATPLLGSQVMSVQTQTATATTSP